MPIPHSLCFLRCKIGCPPSSPCEYMRHVTAVWTTDMTSVIIIMIVTAITSLVAVPNRISESESESDDSDSVLTRSRFFFFLLVFFFFFVFFFLAFFFFFSFLFLNGVRISYASMAGVKSSLVTFFLAGASSLAFCDRTTGGDSAVHTSWGSYLLKMSCIHLRSP